MYFSKGDFEFLRLAGICRYIPTGLTRRYDTPILKRGIITNLQEHRFIKLLSDKMSYKLTKRGRDVLADMGYEFAGDARTNLKKKSYIRKLRNAEWNILLSIAGIDVFYETARELENTDCGYMSCLTLRADKNMKVLSGTKFLGILKIADTAYIPYHIEDETAWIYPVFERETYKSQIDTVRSIRDIKLIVAGKSLEELWNYTNLYQSGDESKNGQIKLGRALEESGSEYLLIPYGRTGVLQMSVMKICRYRERLSKALGCEQREIPHLADCDGMKNNVPYILAIDFNVKRIVRALNQIERYNKGVVPVIYCLNFQKSQMFDLLDKYSTQKVMVSSIDKNFIDKVFPELNEDRFVDSPFEKKGGGWIEVPERRLSKAEIEADAEW